MEIGLSRSRFISPRVKLPDNYFDFSCGLIDVLDKYFVLIAQELYVVELNKFLKRLNGFFRTHPLEIDGYNAEKILLGKTSVTY